MDPKACYSSLLHFFIENKTKLLCESSVYVVCVYIKRHYVTSELSQSYKFMSSKKSYCYHMEDSSGLPNWEPQFPWFSCSLQLFLPFFSFPVTLVFTEWGILTDILHGFLTTPLWLVYLLYNIFITVLWNLFFPVSV